jgi:alkylated DNA repair dioxygenase AlkB
MEQLGSAQQSTLSKDIILTDMHLTFYPSYYSGEECERIMSELCRLDFNSDEESQVMIRGKYLNIPRKQVAFGDENIRTYRFSGNATPNREWPQFICDIKKRLNVMLMEKDIIPQELNYCLVNHYRNGQDYISYHNDDERDLECAVIVSLSFGDTRDFLFKHKNTGDVYKLPLCDGDLLIIRSPTNTHWKHSLPKRARSKSSRYNLTFRIMKPIEE